MLRKCEGCQKLKEREGLIKITRDHKTGELFINPNSKITGRSLYVCKDLGCIKMLLKKKRVERRFKGKTIKESDLEAGLEGIRRQ